MAYLEKPQEVNLLHKLVMMSLALYEYLEIELSFTDKLLKTEFFNHEVFHEYLSQFKEGGDLEGINGTMSTDRVVNSFKNYFKRAEIDLKEVVELQDEFELEYAMSQIFSKKQKEIFLKKLKGEKLTKTEREYYSRSIKKKVLALANPDLHKLASKL
jgi:RNA-splicing ligase RtcB